MSRKVFLTIWAVMFLFFISPCGLSQDLPYAKDVLNALTSKEFRGRGYVKNGEQKAARYIVGQFKKNGTLPLGENGYYQTYFFPINTLPSKITLKANQQELTPGIDYLISSNSPTTKGTFRLVWYLQNGLSVEKILDYIGNINLSDKFLVIPNYNHEFVKNNPLNARGIICLSNKDKLSWTVDDGRNVAKHTTMEIKKEKLPPTTHEIQLSFRSRYKVNHHSCNLLSFVPGTEVPDSFIVFSAHYDHLGMMGNSTCFYGANDNASGTSMVLDLSKHFSKNPSRYSIVFIAFSGEEVGLLGSIYCAERPPFDLKKIRFLINLDMVGTGGDGITVVNSNSYIKEFHLMQTINKQNNYLTQIKGRDQSCNSDHCPFYLKGVPSFFIYTIGEEYQEYHSIYDRGQNLPFTAYENLVKLLLDFSSFL